MATISVAGAAAPHTSASREIVRPSLWRAFIVLVLVAVHVSLSILAWQWTVGQLVSPVDGFGQGLAYLMMSAFIGQAFLFAFWLVWTPLPVWFRLPLVFSIVASVSLAVFDARMVYAAMAVVLIAATILEPLRLLTMWRCDYAPHRPDSLTLPLFPKKLKLCDVGESAATLAVLLGMAWWISGTGPGELQLSSWVYLVVMTCLGLVLCVPVTLLVFSPNSRELWITLGVANGFFALLVLTGMTVFPISILYALVVAGMLVIPQLLCAGTLLLLKKLGWRFYSVASEVRDVRRQEGRVAVGARIPARIWNASIITAMVVTNALFAVAMMRGIANADFVTGWLALLVQGPGIAILIGQLVLLGMWCAWTPMPSWLRFPIILGVGYAVDLSTLGISSAVGVLGALTVAALLEPMRMLTKWRCDYRPGAPEWKTLPPLTFKFSLWEIFEAILSWGIIFGAWRVIATVLTQDGQNNFSGLIEAAVLLCFIAAFAVPASLLVFSPRSNWLWGILITLVVLHLGVTGVMIFWDSRSIVAMAVWASYCFGSTGLCVGTLFVLKKLGWRFYSASDGREASLAVPAFPGPVRTG